MTTFWLCVFTFCLYFTRSESDIKRPRGVSISKAALYAPGKEFHCLDGSAVIPYEQINDDYCDCSDGSDEPGTSACPGGSFHCTNSGHKHKYIPSSRVNDGICDCCDGTDEYEGHVNCANYCRELGQQYREDMEKERKLLSEGHEIYKQYAARGQEAIKETKGRLETAKQEKDDLETKRDELEAIKLEAETPEKEAKDKHKQVWEEEKEHNRAVSDENRAKSAFDALDSNNDNLVTVEEIQAHSEFDIDSNGDVSTEEAKEYLEEEQQVDFDTFQEKIWVNIRDIYKDPPSDIPTEGEAKEDDDELPEPANVDVQGDIEGEDEDEDDDDFRPEPEDYYTDEDDDDGDDDEEQDDGKRKNDEEMPDYDEETKQLIKVADEARFEFNDVKAQVTRLETEIRDMEKLMSLDLGPSSEYYPLKGECYEFTDREYTYKLCPYDKCSQRGKHGGTETSLGTWETWEGEEENRHLAMKYSKGQNCWNGPDRSVKVIISCGMDNLLKSSTEPNRCEYQFTFSTPAACSKPLEPLTKDPNHDEL